jgi:N-acetyl-1-D-myo-inositol-2-amino-2-deoxy-alpha-D-glucopyranoside deacetylase
VSRKLFRRTAFFGLLLPFLYFGTASATFLYRIHAGNSARTNIHLSAIPDPIPSQRLLLFSPHPDDETLGCAGLIQQAVKAGSSVDVVMLTNGDGFRVAVERQLREINIGPDDYVRFADLRQEETFKALANLGLKREDVRFLGYPDRGLLALWNDNWASDHLYTSPYTRRDHSPYNRSYEKGAPYCGQNLLNNINSILRETRPTDVYITHPSDDHPDHSAGSSFVTLALQQMRQNGEAWAQTCKLHYYLVHRGDWPVPQGLYKSDALSPPAEMSNLDTEWKSDALTDTQVERKEKSILSYTSQTGVMKRFLVSFARKNELYSTLEASTVPRVNDGAVTPDGSVSEWKDIKPALLDPVNDSLLRDFQSGGDIKAVYTCHDTTNLYIRIDTYQPVSDRVKFIVRMRYFGDAKHEESGGRFTATIRPPNAVSPSELHAAVSGNRLELAIPLREINYAHNFALNVDTLFAGIQVDRTGYRFMSF